MRALAFLAVLTLTLALALGGTAPFGRVLMAVGLPGLAAHVFQSTEWQGAASYRAGDFDAATGLFTDAEAFYNLGNTEVQRGRYAAALEAFDRARAHGHADAEANFDVVSAFYAGLRIESDALVLFPKRKDGPAEESFIARGDGLAAGTGSEVTNNNTMMGLVELESRGRLGVRQVFDDKFMVADQRWLEQLADVPGEYLAARIALEHKRRVKRGLSPPEPEDPR